MIVDLTSWVVRPAPNARANLRLVCVPGAGGGAAAFRDWSRLLPPSIEVCAIRLPGREDRIAERPLCDIESIVSPLAKAVAELLDRPFAVYGHSVGALIGFELLRRLEWTYRKAAALFIPAAAAAPQWPTPAVRAIHTLPDAAFKGEVARLNGTPPEVLAHAELMDAYLPVLRADFAIAETYVYRPGPPLIAPILAIGGREDGDVPLDALRAWRPQTSRAFLTRQLPGDHFFVTTQRPLMLDLIARTLDRGID